MARSNWINCPTCSSDIAAAAAACPSCGHFFRRRGLSLRDPVHVLGILACIAFLIVIALYVAQPAIRDALDNRQGF